MNSKPTTLREKIENLVIDIAYDPDMHGNYVERYTPLILSTIKEELTKNLKSMNCEVPDFPKYQKILTEKFIDDAILYSGRYNYNKALQDVRKIIEDMSK